MNRQNYRRSERGFSLIELMIVIAIIGILVAVGVPTWKNAVTASNETAAIQTMKTVATEQRTYYIRNKSYGTFDELIKSGALNEAFAGETPVQNGYVFTLKVIPKAPNQQPSFVLNADPQESGALSPTGEKHFYIDSASGTVRVNSTQPAAPEDPPAGS